MAEALPPLEFFVTLMNNQPMGFYPLETLKEDARRFGVTFLNPCVNLSQVKCIPDQGCVLLGLQLVKNVGGTGAQDIVEERERHGRYAGAGDLVRRTGLKPEAVQSLVQAGAFDVSNPNRRAALWDAGLPIRPSRDGQRAFSMSGWESAPDLAGFTEYERMVGEYRVMGIYPRGHVMEFVRPTLSSDVLPIAGVEEMKDGEKVLVSGLARGQAASQGAGWDGIRDHRGRDGGCAAHPLAEGLRPVPQGGGKPGHPRKGPGLQVGRNHQCPCLERRARTHENCHANGP